MAAISKTTPNQRSYRLQSLNASSIFFCTKLKWDAENVEERGLLIHFPLSISFLFGKEIHSWKIIRIWIGQVNIVKYLRNPAASAALPSQIALFLL
jgi:hypothetical protein